MKRILLTLIFFANINLQNHNNIVVIKIFTSVYAQNNNGSTACPTNVSDDCPKRQSLWSWLYEIIKAVGSGIDTVISAIFGGSAGSGTPSQPTEPPNTGPDIALLWSMLNNAQAFGVPSGATHYGNQTGGSIYSPNWPIVINTDDVPAPDVEDCAGVMGGYAFLDQCGTCVGGTTGLLPCYVPPPRTDTMQPVKIPCDSLAIKRSDTATAIMNQIANTPELLRTRDSLNGTHEVSFSTYDSAGITKVYSGSFNVGDTQSVAIYPRDTVTGPNYKNMNAIWHLHQKGIDPFPEPKDLYNILITRTLRYTPNPYGSLNKYNKYLNHSFIICGDTAIDLAIVVYDTAKAFEFLYANFIDSVIKVIDSIGPLYSPAYRGRPSINTPAFNVSMAEDFNNAVDGLRGKNYPSVLLSTYAGVYMMQRYNMGVKTLMKVNGVFKELKADYTQNPNGTIKAIIIKICE